VGAAHRIVQVCKLRPRKAVVAGSWRSGYMVAPVESVMVALVPVGEIS